MTSEPSSSGRSFATLPLWLLSTLTIILLPTLLADDQILSRLDGVLKAGLPLLVIAALLANWDRNGEAGSGKEVGSGKEAGSGKKLWSSVLVGVPSALAVLVLALTRILNGSFSSSLGSDSSGWLHDAVHGLTQSLSPLGPWIGVLLLMAAAAAAWRHLLALSTARPRGQTVAGWLILTACTISQLMPALFKTPVLVQTEVLLFALLLALLPVFSDVPERELEPPPRNDWMKGGLIMSVLGAGMLAFAVLMEFAPATSWWNHAARLVLLAGLLALLRASVDALFISHRSPGLWSLALLLFIQVGLTGASMLRMESFANNVVFYIATGAMAGLLWYAVLRLKTETSGGVSLALAATTAALLTIGLGMFAWNEAVTITFLPGLTAWSWSVAAGVAGLAVLGVAVFTMAMRSSRSTVAVMAILGAVGVAITGVLSALDAPMSNSWLHWGLVAGTGGVWLILAAQQQLASVDGSSGRNADFGSALWVAALGFLFLCVSPGLEALATLQDPPDPLRGHPWPAWSSLTFVVGAGCLAVSLTRLLVSARNWWGWLCAAGLTLLLFKWSGMGMSLSPLLGPVMAWLSLILSGGLFATFLVLRHLSSNSGQDSLASQFLVAVLVILLGFALSAPDVPEKELGLVLFAAHTAQFIGLAYAAMLTVSLGMRVRRSSR